MAPMSEATFFIIFSIWLPQSRLSPIVTQKHLAVKPTENIINCKRWENCHSTKLLPIDTIIMNSILVIFRVSLFALNPLTFDNMDRIQKCDHSL